MHCTKSNIKISVHSLPKYYVSVIYNKQTANWSAKIVTLVQKMKRRVYKIHVFFK